MSVPRDSRSGEGLAFEELSRVIGEAAFEISISMRYQQLLPVV